MQRCSLNGVRLDHSFQEVTEPLNLYTNKSKGKCSSRDQGKYEQIRETVFKPRFTQVNKSNTLFWDRTNGSVLKSRKKGLFKHTTRF